MNFEVSQYLFEPLTTTKAWFLGYDICTQLPQYDPRVKVNNVSVVAHINEGFYTIDLFVGIPNISGDSVKVSALLSQDGFTIL
jgi:phage baseplate assembly protein W